MPAFSFQTADLAIILTVFNRETDNISIGFLSDYTEGLGHPETGNRIEGFTWDNLRWPNPEILNNREVVPTSFDPPRTGISKKHWQAGVGSLHELAIQEFHRRRVDSRDRWVPVVKHGYFYIDNVQYFMFSDGAWTEYIDITDVATVGPVGDTATWNKKQLGATPSGEAPIYIRQYLRDSVTGEVSVRYDWTNRGENPLDSQ